jgi:hypothetical protein
MTKPKGKTRRTAKPKRAPQLNMEQIEIVGRFNDLAWDYPKLSFNEVAKKVLPAGFGTGASAKRFKKEAKEVFDREREP